MSTASTAILLLLLGALVLPVSAQQDRHGGNPGNHGGGNRQPHAQHQHGQPGSYGHHGSGGQPQHRQLQHGQPQHGQPQTRQPQRDHQSHRTPQQFHDWQQKRGWQVHGAWQGHDNWGGGRSAHWQADHRTWGQRGGYGGYRIPQNSFGIYFGPDHYFRIRSEPLIYMGYPRFGYGGYSFMMVDPWPDDWGDDWYASDDVYINYDDGYYLYNRRHPGIAIAVTVVQ